MKREHWKSRLGFIWAAVGSAVGLGSIWRFPYIVGESGGAAFVIVYLICLALVGFPVLIAEILIGRKAQSSPSGAYSSISRSKIWGFVGKLTVVTGFLISSFYGVIAGWTFGYLIEAIRGNLNHFASADEVLAYFNGLTQSTIWALSYFFLFMIICFYIVYTGVRRGIEAANKILMPLLFFVLLALVFKGLSMPEAGKGIAFLFKPDFSVLTPTAILVALGQAFFALSLGQGTMVTYGSYLTEKENIPTTCFPVTIFGTVVSLLAGIAIFPIVFGVGLEPSSGVGLMFKTLPMVFSQIPGGYFLAILFFLLIFLAGLTSQISALEPMISYLIDEKKFKRHKAALATAAASFLVGIPSALSFGILKDITFHGNTFFDILSFLCINIFVPLGGLAAVLLVGWRWGIPKAFNHLRVGTAGLFERIPFVEKYLAFGIKYLAPLIIVFILLDLIGIFK
ncbi:MAG: sodium-dependent transporter [Simkaniaceae bacterium]